MVCRPSGVVFGLCSYKRLLKKVYKKHLTSYNGLSYNISIIKQGGKMKQIQYKGLVIHYCKSWASVKFGDKVWDFKTLKQAKQFITIIEEAI